MTAVRLSSLTPESVANEVLSAVVEHLLAAAAYTDLLTVSGERRPADLVRRRELRWTTADLVTYAQTGGIVSWPVDGAVALVCEALLSCPLYRLEPMTPAGAEALGSTSIGVVCRAALARSQLAAGKAVTQTWLAELASCDDSTVRRDLRSGRLRASSVGRSPITPASALAWLAARGVAGYGAQSREGL